MKVKRNCLILMPVGLIIGGVLFAFGYSLRPERTQIENAQIKVVETAVRTPDAGAADSQEIVKTRLASVATVAPIPAAQKVASSDQAQVRSGVILSMNGEMFILRDDEHNTWYHLDDQKKAGSFLGKKVKVSGEVDPTTDVIHVQSIEEAKA